MKRNTINIRHFQEIHFDITKLTMNHFPKHPEIFSIFISVG